MIALLIAAGATFALMAYACCKVAGDADRQADRLWLEEEEGEEEE